MPTLVIENMPYPLHAELQQVAASNRRSITQQALAFLEQCLKKNVVSTDEAVQPDSKRSRHKEWLKSIKPINVGFPIIEEWLEQAKREGRE